VLEHGERHRSGRLVNDRVRAKVVVLHAGGLRDEDIFVIEVPSEAVRAAGRDEQLDLRAADLGLELVGDLAQPAIPGRRQARRTSTNRAATRRIKPRSTAFRKSIKPSSTSR
jgi:hypothetical protein